jgi:hypothetical protein
MIGLVKKSRVPYFNGFPAAYDERVFTQFGIITQMGRE